ncbi:hypothetical protein KIN20_007361 [Parelaphostrongylus tenuis]|uniref:7TM GPCR serpentine receptor class x (Srx) domain-containing protein n=1 Tax=Parelaphostrongylus tenuis TaxID=148309 RepID=A0AAD5QJZ2_PARTN|nr:hypothetical protein KIN20_007361 [Parelaphostrongylus tenuis]
MAVCENALFIFQHASFHCISPFFEDRWTVFFTGTFLFELCHALDGFIVALFHFRFSYLDPTAFRPKPPPQDLVACGRVASDARSGSTPVDVVSNALQQSLANVIRNALAWYSRAARCTQPVFYDVHEEDKQ